jgi:hypothetical protein
VASPPPVIIDEPIEIASWEEPISNKPRPSWVDDPPKKVGSTWTEVIEAGEYATVEECYESADEKLKAATAQHLEHLIQSEKGVYRVYLPHLEEMGIGLNFIRHEIAREEYVETLQRSFGPMKKLYILLEFNSSVDNDLLRHWDTYVRRDRLVDVSLSASAILSVIGLAFGLLRVDTWTKGYYTKRLFIGVPAAIITVVGALIATLT